MTSTTAQSPIQEITEAEAAAQKRVEEAKRLAIEEVEAFKAEEHKRTEEKKMALKEEERTSLKAEKEGLGTVLKKGKEETDKQMKVLKEKCENNKAGIVEELVDQFLTLKF
jgi:hypothetical protein